MIDINYKAEPYTPHFELIPEGVYRTLIDEISNPTSKAGNRYILLKFKIIEGPLTGRLLFENVNLNSPNPKAQSIAKKILDGIAYALNLEKINNSADILRKPMQIKVGISKEDKNVIRKYYKFTEEVADGKKKPNGSYQTTTATPSTSPSNPPLEVDEEIPF